MQLIQTRDGSAKSFSHSHFRPSPSHRTAFASHFSHFFRIFAFFAPCFTVSALKSSKKCEKMWEKFEIRAKKCECDAKTESKFASHYYSKKNSHRITTAKKKSHFRTFLHRIRIALPSLIQTSGFMVLIPATTPFLLFERNHMAWQDIGEIAVLVGSVHGWNQEEKHICIHFYFWKIKGEILLNKEADGKTLVRILAVKEAAGLDNLEDWCTVHY